MASFRSENWNNPFDQSVLLYFGGSVWHTICRNFGSLSMLGMLSIGLCVVAPVWGQQTPRVNLNSFECGYQSPEQVRAAIQSGVAAGLIPDPLKRVLPKVRARTLLPHQTQRAGVVPTVTSADIFPFEDTNSILLSNFSDSQLFDLMAQASNALMAANGDNFDLIGYFVNFVPNHQIGSAFYLGLENMVTGIGQGSFNFRPTLGIAGNNIEGLVMMWNQASWGPGDTTMLVMGQEFEHRFAMFLAPISGGRSLQGDNAGCGRGSHWSWKVDGQGSGMEIREWIGTNPAILGGDCSTNGFPFICNNSDIGRSPNNIGAVWSYTDLYLMGYVSPAEMDAGNSELRYMENSNCSSNYNGPISTFASADIIAANGVRLPNSTTAQKNFRTGWVMFHQPGAPPTTPQLNNVINILNRWSETWNWSSLGRGTMDNTLGVPCPGHDGDLNGDAVTDGLDIQMFVDSMVNGTVDPAIICSGDFNSSGNLDIGDVSGMVTTLLLP